MGNETALYQNSTVFQFQYSMMNQSCSDNSAFICQHGAAIQTGAGILTMIGVFLAAFLASKVGKKQNTINERALHLQDFVELFIMPQQVVQPNSTGQNVLIGWNLIIKNAGAFPIYLNEFTLNGNKHKIGDTVIPAGMENWYAVPIPTNLQQKGNLKLYVKFEDYLGRKYSSVSNGDFQNGNWNIRTEKKKLLGKHAP